MVHPVARIAGEFQAESLVQFRTGCSALQLTTPTSAAARSRPDDPCT